MKQKVSSFKLVCFHRIVTKNILIFNDKLKSEMKFNTKKMWFYKRTTPIRGREQAVMKKFIH